MYGMINVLIFIYIIVNKPEWSNHKMSSDSFMVVSILPAVRHAVAHRLNMTKLGFPMFPL